MDGEQESIAEVEQETPAIETEIEADEPVNLDASDEDQDVEDELQPEDDDSEEFDWNGKKVKGPKGLKDGVLMHADYTRKTQETSALRKELDDRSQRLDQQFQASEEYLDARADLRVVAKELERFKEYDWTQYQQHRLNDPLSADEAWNYAQHLRNQKGQLEASIQQHEGRRTAEAQQSVAKRMQETHEHVKANLKGWTPETDKQVIDFAMSKGISQDELRNTMDPRIYEMIYLARIGAQVLNKPAPKPTAQAKPTEPLKVVGGRSTPAARKSLGEMSMEEYAAARQAGRGA
jgi:hypothetical protein